MSDTALNAEPNYGTSKKTFPFYFVGLLLCVVLTIIPFFAVQHHLVSHGMKLFVVFASAILQFLVQVICFLRLTPRNQEGKLNILSFVFTTFVLLVVVLGSIWIMVNLNYNMMH